MCQSEEKLAPGPPRASKLLFYQCGQNTQCRQPKEEKICFSEHLGPSKVSPPHNQMWGKHGGTHGGRSLGQQLLPLWGRDQPDLGLRGLLPSIGPSS